MSMRLDWYGDSHKKRARRAAKVGINKTLNRCVKLAKPPFPKSVTGAMQSRLYVTGTYARSIRANRAKDKGKRVVGLWGSFDVLYAIYIEARYFVLRGAARMGYPDLHDNVREAYEKAT